MSESFPIVRTGMPYTEFKEQSSATNPLQKKINPKSQKLFELFFDTPEKCQMAINAINSNELGAAEQFRELVDILERRKFEVPNGRGFTQNEQLNMTNYDYALKELNLVLEEDIVSNNKVYSNDKPYQRVIQGLTSAKECQVLIDKILDGGKIGGFDTQTEIRKLLEMLEKKKLEFEPVEVQMAEDADRRNKMSQSRKTNNYAVDILEKEYNNLHDRQRQIHDEMGAFSAAAMAAWSAISGEEDPYVKLYSHTEKLHMPFIKLLESKELLTEEEFAEKANKLLGAGSYDLQLVKKLAKDYDKYITAIKLPKIQEMLTLEESSDNITKFEEMFGGKEFLNKHILNYNNLPDSDKFKVLKNLIKLEEKSLKDKVGDKSLEDTKKEYLENYSKFLQNMGIEDLNKSLDEFKSDSETAGNVLKFGTTLAAMAGTLGLVALAGGALVAVGTAAKIGTGMITTIKAATAITAGGVAAGTTFGLEYLDKDLFDKEKFNKALESGEIKDMGVHSAITGGFTAATFGAGALIAEGGAALMSAGTNPFSAAIQSATKMFVTDSVLGIGELAAHNAYEGKSITDISGKDVVLTLSTSLVANGTGVVATVRGARPHIINDKKIIDKTDGVKAQDKTTSETSNNSVDTQPTETTRISDLNKAKETKIRTNEEINAIFLDDEAIKPLPPVPQRPSTVQKPEATSIPVIHNTQTKVYQENEVFVFLSGDDLYMGEVKISAELLEKTAQSKSGRLGNMAKYTRTLVNAPEGTAIHVKKAKNGYMVTVKGGEVAHSPQIKETSIGTKQPMGQDIQVVQGKQAKAAVVPPRPVDLNQQASAPVATKATPTEDINKRVSAISDSLSWKNRDGKYIKLQKQSCVEAVGLDDTKVKLGDTEICLSQIEGLSTKLKDISDPVPVYIVNGEFRLEPNFRLLKKPVFYVAKERNGAITLTANNSNISVTNVRKPELWRRYDDFEELPTTPRVVTRNIEFITIDGNKFILDDVYDLSIMENGITYHVKYDGEKYCVATLEEAIDSTGVFIRKVGDKIEAFGTNGKGAGIMKPDVYNELVGEWINNNVRRRRNQ